jgi:archaeal type IV pilus assembly protein PilA
MRTSCENAVSPVVGVMLMLVVVIIIAAVVSGFAGGLVQGNKMAPQAKIQGTCYVNSSSNLVILTHMGGDELIPAKTQVVIKKGDDWGSYTGILSGYTQQIDPAKIHDSSNKFWLNTTTGAVQITVWRPGESMYIDSSGATSSDVGKSFDLEVNTIDGKTISKSKMMIVP